MNKWKTFFATALLLVSCALAYDPMRKENSSGDTISARYWPVAVLKHHTWTLTPFFPYFKELGAGYSGIPSPDGSQLYPRNGWGMAPLTIPFYFLADTFNWGGEDWTPDRINLISRWNAIALATASVLLLFFLCLRFCDLPTSFFAAALFAFGTWNWSMAPQGLYSQTAAVLVHLIYLHLLLSLAHTSKRESVFLLTFLIALTQVAIFSIRPQDVVLTLPVFLMTRNRKTYPVHLVSLALFSIPLLLEYRQAYGFYLGAYGMLESLDAQQTWRANGLAGLVGLLFSPNRGALFFLPILLTVPFLAHRFFPDLSWRSLISLEKTKKDSVFYFAALSGALYYLIMLSFVNYWHGSWAYGPRYLYDPLPYLWPILALMVGDLMKRFQKKGKPLLSAQASIVCTLASLQGVAIHALGHRNYDLYTWNYRYTFISDQNAWNFKDLMIAEVWRIGSNVDRYPVNARERLKRLGF